MYNGCPLFPGQNDKNQLDTIFQKLGTPTIEQWPQSRQLDWNPNTPNYPPQKLEDIVPRMSPEAIDLLSVWLSPSLLSFLAHVRV